MEFQFFIDFDGTIAKNDVGNEFFRKYTGDLWQKPIRRWLNGEIGSKECLSEECSYVSVSKQDFREFALMQELDPGFPEFYAMVKANNWPVTILSDGMDFYIENILKKYAYSEIPFYSNHVVFEPGGGIKPEFPHHNEGCGKCGNCKATQVRRLKIQGVPVVYIGDGMSDKCGSLESDIIFAKKDLLRYLRGKDVFCYEYKTFHDIIPVLASILNK